MASLANLVASGATREPSRPIVRLGPHTFAHGRRAVIFRYITADELDELRAATVDRITNLGRAFAPNADPEALAVFAHAASGAGEQVGRWWLRNPDVPRARVVGHYIRACAPALAQLRDPGS